MLCYFVRHGEAENTLHIHDSERALTEFGQQQALSVGTFIAKLPVHPERILTSPLLRARQTASVINQYLHVPVETTEYLINGVDIRQLFEYLNAQLNSSLLLVGHQPSLGEIISYLLTKTSEIDLQMKPCTIVALDISKPIKAGTAKLLFALPYTIIDQLLKKE